MFKRIDRSVWLSKMLDRLSDSIAKQRGLPIVVGIALVIVSFILQSIAVVAPSPSLEFLGVVALHVGVLTALIGMVLVTPFGGS